MDCPHCGGPTRTLAVPAALPEPAPGAAAAVCEDCLLVHEADGTADGGVAGLSDALPDDGDAAAAAVLLAGALDSVASNRRTLEALAASLEDAGVDPALTVERLAEDRAFEPAVALPTRYEQFRQLRRT